MRGERDDPDALSTDNRVAVAVFLTAFVFAVAAVVAWAAAIHVVGARVDGLLP